MKKVVVIGAGFAGCMYSNVLKEKGWDVTVIDKAPFTGGGVRTFFYAGHPYTYGPHYLNTPDEEVYQYIDKIVPQRLIDKINYSYQSSEDQFVTFPIHQDDIDNFPEATRIRKELENLSNETEASNFEEYWHARVGKTLYERYIKFYNMKAWLLESNTEMEVWDARESEKVKVKPKRFETGSRYEFPDYFQCYPLAKDGYNHFFDYCLDGCNVMLNTTISKIDVDKCQVILEDGNKIKGDIMISTTSPDCLFEFCYGKLPFIGRDFHKIVLPTEHVFPKDVYFLYYPGEDEKHTRIVEYKKFSLYESPNSLIISEVPSTNGKYYPVINRNEIEKAQKYINLLPSNIFSVGRAGLYRYVDMSEITRHGIDFQKNL